MLERCVQGYIPQLTYLAIVNIRLASFAAEQSVEVRDTVWTEFKIMDGSVFFKTVFDPSDGFPHTPSVRSTPMAD